MIKPAPDSCHLLLDSRLANEEVQKNPYTYNNIREVLSDGALNAATVEHPVTVYIAPGIYWLEDPQSEAVIVREDPKDLYPYGCKVNCANLKFVERFLELSLFYRLFSPLDSEMICIFPYFCPYAESAREIREIFV